MSNAEDHECTGCNAQEVEALMCELLDTRQSAERQREIRARLAECSQCLGRLHVEEVVRALMRDCRHAEHAPERLRENITIQIRRAHVTTYW